MSNNTNEHFLALKEKAESLLGELRNLGDQGETNSSLLADQDILALIGAIRDELGVPEEDENELLSGGDQPVGCHWCTGSGGN